MKPRDLQEAELALTALRAASLELGPATMGLPWLCAIHQTLFQDIYPWAGQLRRVDFIKTIPVFVTSPIWKQKVMR